MTNKETFLTIGEVSKIMDVNAKSLRYYERIGALIPAYIDQKTGYRYYSHSQLAIVNAIQICIEIGIPLKQFSKYCVDNQINAGLLLEEATILAETKINNIRKGLHTIEQLQNIIKKSDALIATKNAMPYDLPSITYIVERIPDQLNTSSFNKVLSRLHFRAIEIGYHPGMSFGRLYVFNNDKVVIGKYAFTSVSGAKNQEKGIIELAAGQYWAIHTTESRIAEASTIFSELFAQDGYKIVLEAEAISSVYNTEKVEYDIYCQKFSDNPILI